MNLSNFDSEYGDQGLGADFSGSSSVEHSNSERIEQVDEQTPEKEWGLTLKALYRKNYTEASAGQIEYGLFEVFRPLIDQSYSKVKRLIRQNHSINRLLPESPEKLAELLLPQVLDKVQAISAKTLVLELNVSRVSGDLEGKCSKARFDFFISLLKSTPKRYALMEEYPCLFILVWQSINLWQQSVTELLIRLAKDWTAIQENILKDSRTQIIVAFKSSCGDEHARGRAVAILETSAGDRIVYKPRAPSADNTFIQLIDWYVDSGFPLSLKAPRILDRDTYYWSEFITQKECKSKLDVQHFYYRLGGLLALFYAMRATDFHAENIISSGSYPIPIDLETLFHIQSNGSHANKLDSESLQDEKYSVLNIGLLPNKVWAKDGHTGIDNSGIGGRPGQPLSTPVQRFVDQNTDLMRIEEQTAFYPKHKHIPTLNNEDIDVNLYSNFLVDGFSDGYQIILENRHSHSELEKILENTASISVRAVIRPSQVYARLLAESYHPQLMKSFKDRQDHFKLLYLELENRPGLKRAIKLEIDDLEYGDIPIFTTTPSSISLFSSKGEEVKEILYFSALTRIKNTMKEMGATDRDRQLWIIKASLATLTNHENKNTKYAFIPKIQPLQNSDEEETKKNARSLAKFIAEELITHSSSSNGLSDWFSFSSNDGIDWRLSGNDVSLYQGSLGIGLFLAYLYKETKNNQSAKLAKSAISKVNSRIARMEPIYESNNIGFMSGWGGYFYCSAHYSIVFNDSSYYEKALFALNSTHFLDAYSYDNFDIMSGHSGLIMGLYSLWLVKPSSQLESLIEKSANRLVDMAITKNSQSYWLNENLQRSLTGLSHGSSGVIAALSTAAKVLKTNDYNGIIVQAINFEAHNYSKDSKNWLDLRLNQSNAQTYESSEDMVAWCHGATGVGISRLLAKRFFQDNPSMNIVNIIKDLEVAIEKVFKNGFSKSHCLCHGAIGNLDFLIAYQKSIPSNKAIELNGLVKGILQHIKINGLQGGIPLSSDSFGLMIGLAGMGMGMLRYFNPKSTPSVTCFEPPIFNRL